VTAAGKSAGRGSEKSVLLRHVSEYGLFVTNCSVPLLFCVRRSNRAPTMNATGRVAVPENVSH